jgi:hypothetical protein
MERKEETKLVKRAVIAAGFDQNNVTVKHGHGTAWGWLTVSADIHRAPSCSCGAPDQYGRRETCEECKTWWRSTYNRLIEVAQQTTGRHGDYDGRINVNLGFFA